MLKVSVIMPSLNVAPYIQECLDSVASQTLSDIEMLVVDAGSTDGTAAIVQSYAERDPRIKLIRSEQRSYGHQVNLGIEAAAGEYIGIVDTDDRIKPDMYETLYQIAAESGADYVKGTAEMFFSLGDFVYRRPLLQFSQDQYGKAGVLELCPHEMPELLIKDCFLWYGIYRSNFFKQFRLHESPGAAFQDFGGLLQTQLNARKAIYISKPCYEYRQDNVNASIYNKKGFRFVCDEYGWAERFIEGQSVAWQASFYRKLFLHALDRFSAMAASGSFWQETEPDMLEIANRLQGALNRNTICEADFKPEEWENLQLMLRAPRDLYDRMFRESMQRSVLIGELIAGLTKENLVIFGSGVLGGFFHGLLLSRSWKNVTAYCDNQNARQGTALYGLPILSPEQAVAQYPVAQYVVANMHHSKEMAEQLLALGIHEHQIHIFDSGSDLQLLRPNTIKISVIVTVHNAEKYLRECLDSLLAQTFRDFEVLCMDGGSTDASPQILEEYAAQDERFRIVNDPNTSYGHKVNEGIRLARGAYISVLESDDMYMPDMLERLYTVAQRHCPDFVNADYVEFWDAGALRCRKLVKMYPPEDYDHVLESGKHPEAMRQILRYWTGIFRRDFLIWKEIRMNESPGASFQDISFRFLTSALADTAYHIDAPVYLYRMDNPNSSVYDPRKAVITADEYDFLQLELERRGMDNPYIWRHFYVWKYNDICGNLPRFAGDAQQALYERCLHELERDRLQLERYEVQTHAVAVSNLLQKPVADLWTEFEAQSRALQVHSNQRKKFFEALNGTGVVIFGCGKRGSGIMASECTIKERICCWTDNNKELWHMSMAGRPILEPKEAVERYPDALYIVASKYCEEEIKEQLQILGIPDRQIFYYSNIC